MDNSYDPDASRSNRPGNLNREKDSEIVYPSPMQSVLEYLEGSWWLTLEQLLVVLGPLLLLAFLLQQVSRFVRNRGAAILGGDVYAWLTAPGVMIHELGHVVFCVLFAHRIVKVRLFKPDSSGTLGVVEHAYNPRNPYQVIGNFFIGTGPIWFGSAIVYLLTRYLLGWNATAETDPGPQEMITTMHGPIAVLAQVAAATWGLFTLLLQTRLWTGIPFWAFLYLVFCIGSHITLSRSDIRGAWRGFIAMIAALLVFNLITLRIWSGSTGQACDAIVQRCILLYAAILLVVAMNLVFAVVVTVLPRRR